MVHSALLFILQSAAGMMKVSVLSVVWPTVLFILVAIFSLCYLLDWM